MSYHAAIYMKDLNGDYTIPVYNEYQNTKLLRVGFIAKLLRGITVDQATIQKGIELNQYYGTEPDAFATELLAMSLNGPVNVCIENIQKTVSATPRYYIITKDVLGCEEKFAIPREATKMSSVLFGDWLNQIDDRGPEVNEALKICKFYQFENDDVAIKGGFK